MDSTVHATFTMSIRQGDNLLQPVTFRSETMNTIMQDGLDNNNTKPFGSNKIKTPRHPTEKWIFCE